MKPKKVGNIKDAVALARRTLAVAVAMGRAKCLSALLHEEIDRHMPGGLPELASSDWQEFRVNGATRQASLFTAYFASLDAVIDGWRHCKLTDPIIDGMLKSPHAQGLAGFRNAMLHPRSLVDDRLKRMHANRKELLAWSDELGKALEDYFTRWYVSLNTTTVQGPTPRAESR